jgi:hypothetical protein
MTARQIELCLPDRSFIQPVISVLVFYDAPTPPAGIFDGFLDITFVHQDILTRTYAALVGTFGGDMMQTRYLLSPTVVSSRLSKGITASSSTRSLLQNTHMRTCVHSQMRPLYVEVLPTSSLIG